MNIEDIRRNNLLILLEENDGREKLSELSGLSPSHISQLKSSNKKVTMGTKIARRLEEATGKREGWMDASHTNSHSELIAQVIEKLDKNVSDGLIAFLAHVSKEPEKSQLLALLETQEEK